MQRHPEVELRLEEANTHTLRNAVGRGASDIAFAFGAGVGFGPQAVSFVTAKLTVALVPASMQRMRAPGVRYLPLSDVQPSISLCMVRRRGDPSKVVQNLVALVRTPTRSANPSNRSCFRTAERSLRTDLFDWISPLAKADAGTSPPGNRRRRGSSRRAASRTGSRYGWRLRPALAILSKSGRGAPP